MNIFFSCCRQANIEHGAVAAQSESPVKPVAMRASSAAAFALKAPSPPRTPRIGPINIPDQTVARQPSATFEFRPDGTCVPSDDYHSYFPECHKSYKDFGDPLGSFFTPMERDIFIQAIDACHIITLADTVSVNIMKQLQIGYIIQRSETFPTAINDLMPIVCHHLSLDPQLSELLTDSIFIQMKIALAPPAALLERKEPYSFPSYYFDIPIISEERNGLLQQIKHECDGKYLDSIESLKTNEGRPISSVVCRLILKEQRQETSGCIHFAYEILVNDKQVNKFILPSAV